MLQSHSSDQALINAHGFMGSYMEGKIAMERPHLHHEIEMNYVKKGSFKFYHQGKVFDVGEGTLMVFWGACPHRILESCSASFYWFTIPLIWCLQWRLNYLERLLKGEICFESSTSGYDGERCAYWIEDLSSNDENRMEVTRLEIEARLKRFALDFRKKSKNKIKEVAYGDGMHPNVDKISEYIALHYRSSLKLNQIAKAVKLHPNYMANLFRKHTGFTIQDYIIQNRLFYAAQLLVNSDKKVTDIAYDSGFGSISSFYDCFTRFFRVSPRLYRKMNTSGVTK